ncbi:MAG: hypothetical protein DMG40_04140 [Acidobacteria bacterium]|nr:MAG: hypothetical protein DMG40_04140 [Acidobacteriota bacterium]
MALLVHGVLVIWFAVAERRNAILLLSRLDTTPKVLAATFPVSTASRACLAPQSNFQNTTVSQFSRQASTRLSHLLIDEPTAKVGGFILPCEKGQGRKAAATQLHELLRTTKEGIAIEFSRAAAVLR